MQKALTASGERIKSIDLLRGLVMIIMALYHTRDLFHKAAFSSDPLDLATTTPFLFFTRWITHFCAPVFVFLSGLSAWLQSIRKPKKELSRFLISRGLWLILVEIFIVTAWDNGRYLLRLFRAAGYLGNWYQHGYFGNCAMASFSTIAIYGAHYSCRTQPT